MPPYDNGSEIWRTSRGASACAKCSTIKDDMILKFLRAFIIDYSSLSPTICRWGLSKHAMCSGRNRRILPYNGVILLWHGRLWCGRLPLLGLNLLLCIMKRIPYSHPNQGFVILLLMRLCRRATRAATVSSVCVPYFLPSCRIAMFKFTVVLIKRLF